MTSKPVIWIASSKKDLLGLPKNVRADFGNALWEAQIGEMSTIGKFFKGHGAKVIELRLDYGGDAFRAVYTVKFPKAIVVLHVFQKKSKKGIETPKPDIEVILSRLKLAEEKYKEWEKTND